MITANFIKRIDDARVGLSECRTLEEIDKVFSEFEITDYPSKAALLRRCMGIQELDTTANDEAAYNAYLRIFLTGKWRDINLMKEPTMPDSNLLSEAIKKQTKKSKETFNVKEVYEYLDLSEEDYNGFKNFYEMDILPRIQKKFLSQLISAIEDMIDEKVHKRITIERNKGARFQDKGRYRIILAETTPGLVNNNNAKSLCLVFPDRALVLYDPNMDIRTIRISIAHELGHLLSYHGIIPSKDTERYANLFAFFAIKEENNFYASGNFSNFYRNEMEIIKNIKAISSIKNK